MSKYRLAADRSDMRMAQRFLREQGFAFDHTRLSFPVVMAFADGKLVGVFGTTIQDDMIIAGPMAVLDDRPRWRTALRLFDLYDVAMAAMGVSSYVVAAEQGSVSHKAIKTAEGEPYAVKGDMEYFIRRLRNDGRRHDSRSTEANG